MASRAPEDKGVRGEDAAVPIRGLGPGSRLGRYELLAPVGQGGMAVVWAARLLGPRGFSKLVAVKTMLPALSADPRFEKMFLAEASFAATLKHPHVCEVLDLGEEQGLLYLAMEWVQGDSLAAVMAAHPQGMPCGVVARIAALVARGLHAAHEATDAAGTPLELVHRDVSPQNILVGLDGIAKIADFGVAKIGGGPGTQAGYVKGKVRYMAPEQVYCEKVDRRTDVFALGVVVYEATTRRHPFAGPTDVATLAAIAGAEEAARPGSLVPGYPPALEAVVMRALAKEPSERFATMDELADALERAGGADVTADDVGAVVRAACGTHVAQIDSAIERARSTSPSVPPAPLVRGTARGASPSRAFAVAMIATACAAIAVTAVTIARPPPQSHDERAVGAAPASVAGAATQASTAMPLATASGDPSVAAPPSAGPPAAPVPVRSGRARTPDAGPFPSASGRPSNDDVLETRE